MFLKYPCMGSLATVFIIFSPYLYFFSAADETTTPPAQDPAIYYTMIELICSEGFYAQEHSIITDDGYFLRLYRIPGGKRRPKVIKKKTHYYHVHLHHHPDFNNCVQESMNYTFKGPPVLMSHGLSAASDCWVLQGAGYDLAFILADLGYDVWLSNIRGNFYSKRHKTLRIQERAFWDYSFHENGVYDMPNTIDYILNLTKFKKLFYIGHSMGTTMFFVMTSMRPEYNEKIMLFVGLTPVGHTRWESYDSSTRAILHALTLLVETFVKNGVYQFFPRSNFANSLTSVSCSLRTPNWLQDLCYDATFFFTGNSSKLYTREKLAVFLGHAFSGISVKTFLHYAQLLFAPKFQNYDYGPEENFRRYAQSTPPLYDVSKITAPVALFYSEEDYVSSYKDVLYFMSLLPNLVKGYKYNQLNHVDFIWAYNARTLIYKDVVQLMEKYRKSMV